MNDPRSTTKKAKTSPPSAQDERHDRNDIAVTGAVIGYTLASLPKIDYLLVCIIIALLISSIVFNYLSKQPAMTLAQGAR